MSEVPNTIGGGEGAGDADTPLQPLRTILGKEIRQAEEELQRPLHGIFVSGLLAGMGVGTSTFALATTLTLTAGEVPPGIATILGANAYSVGFIIVILAHTDLFTEYTTLAILPVLTGRARTRALARLWSFVYLGNMTGAAIFAFLLARLGTGMEIIELHALEEIAGRLIDHPWWAILLSATLVGWLMGLLSWLIASADETVSRILFIWIVTGAIGLGHLHHSVTGALDAMAALFAGAAVPIDAALLMVLWTTLGNAAGGIVFAVLIRYGLVLGADGEGRAGEASA